MIGSTWRIQDLGHETDDGSGHRRIQDLQHRRVSIPRTHEAHSWRTHVHVRTKAWAQKYTRQRVYICHEFVERERNRGEALPLSTWNETEAKPYLCRRGTKQRRSPTSTQSDGSHFKRSTQSASPSKRSRCAQSGGSRCIWLSHPCGRDWRISHLQMRIVS